MAGAVAVVFALAYADLLREEAHALDDFTSEQMRLARTGAEVLYARLGRVDRDVQRLDASLIENASAVEEPLRKLLALEPAYREIDLFSARGAHTELALGEKHALAETPSLAAARDGLIAHLPQRDLIVTAGTTDERAHLRLFALNGGAQIIVMLVDLDGVFLGASAETSEVPTRWLLVDDAQHVLSLGPREAPPAAAARTLLAAMNAGQEGRVLLSRETAAAFGLGARRAVAGYAPIARGSSLPWSIVLITSARRVRDRARAGIVRLAAATGVAALLVALFGLALSRQQRRAERLGHALRLAETTASLRERSEKMMEALPMGVLVLDDQHHVTSVNAYLAERGVHAAASLSEALPDATREDLAALEALVEDVQRRHAPSTRSGLSLRLGATQKRDIDAYAIPLLGAPAQCFLVLHDRTELRALERSLQRAEKLATIGTLAAGVAHEIGTPLGIISGRAEQLLARVPAGEGEEPTRKSVASILTQVDKVGQTIRQLLDFARTRPIETAAVSPATALASAAALLDHRFRKAKVTLHVDAYAAPAVAADPGQLEQVLVNLLLNACDACAPGGQVWASASDAGERVALEVRDDGHGILADQLAMIFDPFFTTKKRGQGTGLGLSIAADIVKNHGGSIEVDSVVGTGTTMRVLLPKATKGSAP